MDSQAKLPRELALRIGLAAHALPDTNAKRLMSVLLDCIELPITEQKIDAITLDTFKSAHDGEFRDIDVMLLQQALTILKSASVIAETSAPEVEVVMPGSVRIAITSTDSINVDGHFGSCQQFMIFQVSADESRLIGLRNAEIPEGLEVDDKNLYRAELIQDCQVLYTAAVGGPAAAKIVKLCIHPIKLPDVKSINEVIEELQEVIGGTPPPWLAKVMGIDIADRFKFVREASA